MTTVESMNNLARPLDGKGDNGTAERLYQRALVMAGRTPVPSGPANVGEAGRIEARLKAMGKNDPRAEAK